MLNIFKIFKKSKKEEKVDKVYEFFVNGKSKDRKKAYNRALQMAEKDQLAILKKAESMK